MNSNKVLGLTCIVISCALVSPVPLANDVFDEFLQDGPSKNNFIVKRRIFEDNADRQLKQISLSALVGDFEKNIFASALSVNKVLTDENVTITEIKADNASHEDVNKSQTLTKEEKKDTAAIVTTPTTETSFSLQKTDIVVLQTTEKVPQTIDTPPHIIIDRIAIQPHTGGVALIPVFELKQTVKDEDPKKDHEGTNITTSKTELTSLATATPELSKSSSSPSTTTTEDVSVTTPKYMEQLKEAEEELKEKFAEIEAEPVILSARV